MPIHPFDSIRGRIETFTIESKALAGNMLGDPSKRSVSVYLPPNYEADTDTPLLVDLVGFTGSGFAHTNWKPFAESVPQRHERLVKEEKMGPCVIAFPDCFTSLGGNQYIDSSAMGDWASFLTDEMLPELEERYGTKPGRDGRGVFGKSSGGYGAIMHGLRYAQHWGAVACHSGDMGFDRLFLGDFPKILNRLDAEGGIESFFEKLDSADKVSGDDFHVLLVLAMAATYDPCAESFKGIRLPVDMHTCELDADRWQAWMNHDPVTLVDQAECQNALRSLKGIYIDCGSKDQYNIHYGSRQFCKTLDSLGIGHRYDEFDDTHSNVDYRMDESLPFLYDALTKS